MNSTSYIGPRTPRKEDDLSVSVVMPMYTVRRTLYSVHYSLYSVRRVHYICLGCTTSCVQCTLYSKLAILNVYPEIYFRVQHSTYVVGPISIESLFFLYLSLDFVRLTFSIILIISPNTHKHTHTHTHAHANAYTHIYVYTYAHTHTILLHSKSVIRSLHFKKK